MKKLTLILLSILMIVTLAACGDKCEHTYDNACDVTCNECGEERTVTHDFADADCDTPKTCKTCGATEGEMLPHNWEDATCITAKTCKTCGATEGAALGHDWTTPDVDLCEVQSTCSRCGATDGENKEHTPAEDDGDCTTAITCTVCGDELVPASAGHTPAEDDGDCTTELVCETCGYILIAAREEHTGGTPTCVGSSCEVCSTLYGEADENAHGDMDRESGLCKNGCGSFIAVASVDGTYYSDLEGAFYSWADGTTLTLHRDTPEIGQDIKILNTSLTLDLNGYAFNFSSTEDYNFVVGDIMPIFEDEHGNRLEMPTVVVTPGALTIRDSRGGGSLNAYYDAVRNNDTLTVEGGLINGLILNSGTMNMSGGRIVGYDNLHGIWNLTISNYGTLNISGGELYGKHGIWTYGGSVTNISGSPLIEGSDHGQNIGFAIYVAEEAEVNILGTPTLRAESKAELCVHGTVRAAHNPTDAVWRIHSDSNSGKRNGVVVIPEGGVILDPTRFLSAVDGFTVRLNSRGELVLCDCTTECGSVSHGDGTHDTTCACGAVIFTEDVACAGETQTCMGVLCDVCGTFFGEATEGAHLLSYTALDNLITESCTAGCGHSATATLSATDATYDGTEHETSWADYSDGWLGERPLILYKNNKNAGRATAMLTVDGATATAEFTVESAILDVIANDSTITYGDEPSFNGVTFKGFVGGEDESVLVGELSLQTSYKQYDDVGAYTISPSGLYSNNYLIFYTAGNLEVKVKKVGVDTEFTVTLDNESYVVDGTPKEPEVTSIVVEGRTLIEGTDYTVSYEDNVYVSEKAAVVINFMGNYDGTFKKYFTITQDPDTTEFDGEWVTLP